MHAGRPLAPAPRALPPRTPHGVCLLDPCLPGAQVRDSLGRLVELPHDTHPGSYRCETGVITVNATVALQTPLAQAPPGEAASAACRGTARFV